MHLRVGRAAPERSSAIPMRIFALNLACVRVGGDIEMTAVNLLARGRGHARGCSGHRQPVVAAWLRSTIYVFPRFRFRLLS